MENNRSVEGRQTVSAFFNNSEIQNIEHLSVFDMESGRCIVRASSFDEFLASTKVLSNLYLIVINYRGGNYITRFSNI